jgi:hypothetical protein
MKNIASWIIVALSLPILLLPFATGNLMGYKIQWSVAQIISNVASPSDNTLAQFVHDRPPETDGVGRIIEDNGLNEADLAKLLPFLCTTVYAVFAIAATSLRNKSRWMIVSVAAVGCIASLASIGVVYLLNEALIRSIGDPLRGAEGTVGYNIGLQLLKDVWLRPAVGAYSLAGCSAMLLVAQALSFSPRKSA